MFTESRMDSEEPRRTAPKAENDRPSGCPEAPTIFAKLRTESEEPMLIKSSSDDVRLSECVDPQMESTEPRRHMERSDTQLASFMKLRIDSSSPIVQVARKLSEEPNDAMFKTLTRAPKRATENALTPVPVIEVFRRLSVDPSAM